MSLITPRTPPGTMELLPRQQVAFQRLLDTIRRGYERFGFVPVETPVFETVDTLLTKSGGETEKQVYFVQSTGALQQGNKPDIALRFDLTVPLARYVAEHERDLAFPFRRYQIQRVYRGERAQRGRFREFYQCDIDVIGKDSLSAHYDAEIPAVIYHVFKELDFGGFTINVNNRKVLLGLLDGLGVDDAEKRVLVLREIDKLDKIGRDKVQASLTGLGMTDAAAEKILSLIDAKGTNEETLAALGALGIENETFRQGVAELTTVIEGLKALQVPDGVVRINLAIARGLDYYTGTVYETFLNDHPGIGSVCSGGRYDNLASHYTKSKLPGVGISIGATRLFYQLMEAGIIKGGGATAQVLVTQMDPALSADYYGLATALRAAGINTEIQLDGGKLAKQMKYADKAGIPLVVLMGSDEKARGTATLKHLVKGEQVEVPLADLAAKAKELLGA
ncbi:histidine--tRNA ligase [Azospirillum brasilense]|uniref:Histidine--tRNA ligase n=1 Tax=Azospirillum brasilense TaxID=192 RepID=A0A0P0EYY7_AZOBR|nr:MULTISPECIES: histidine--tRNA ligase [Azospirillum]ALJ35959.1 histidine--tRNA ligase [Azospirillum brasilense]MDW7552371.1 histidine--tRNA ligase [Azospirillum brasilense]MDW7592439.1 histidine--tRNA ligase [Azospirillum brasilense]MDW7596467.1 histidine--tRNA ligase [Azospirillum brasilense]MDW7627569.1 histidine--tRNA ligase [Azospirillum brasilense]